MSSLKILYSNVYLIIILKEEVIKFIQSRETQKELDGYNDSYYSSKKLSKNSVKGLVRCVSS